MEAGSALSLCDITQCSICLESFKEPKMLPCIHTFCLQCLQKLCNDNDSGDDVACPLCRKMFSVPPGGIQDLPSNFFMNQFMQFSQSSITRSTEAPSDEVNQCELCFEATATTYCVECEQHICGRCSTIHRNQKVSKSHQLVSMKNKPSGEGRLKMAVDYCEQHPEEQIKLYCYDCKTVTCLMCYVEKHNKHECVDVKKSVVRFSEQLQRDIDQMKICVSDSRDELEELKIRKKGIIEDVLVSQKMIANKCNQLIALVQSHEAELMEELNSFKDKQLKEMSSRIADVERQFVIGDSLMRYSQKLKDEGTPSEISRAAYSVHDRADELAKTLEEEGFSELRRTLITFRPSPLTTGDVKSLIGELSFKDDTLEDNTLQQDCQARAFLDEPQLVHVIPRNGAVLGITVSGNEVFAVRAAQRVDVYNITSFKFTHAITIPGSKSLSALVASRNIKCVYISDDGKKVIYRYNHLLNKVITRWSVGGLCLGLSLAKNNNLLVTLYNTKQIHEYSPNGGLIREINLDSALEHPVHCIQLSSDLLVVSHQGTKQSGVSVVDTSGTVVMSCCNPHGSDPGDMNRPRHIAVDKHDHVLVADWLNNRIELLSPVLAYLGYIEVPEHGLNMPWALHLDQHSRRLYIGERAGERVFVLHADISDDEI